MPKDYRRAIETLIEERATLLEEAASTGRLINQLCRRSGDDPMFPDDETDAEVGGAMVIRRAEFFGMKLATAVRAYLDKRGKDRLGPATAPEIYDALLEGGFEFETPDRDKELHRLKTSLGKNTATFIKVPGGDEDTYAPLDWYPEKRAAKRSRAPVIMSARSGPGPNEELEETEDEDVEMTA